MGKASESLKDKGAVVSAFPADYIHNSSPTLECSHSGTGILFIHLTLLARTSVANLSRLNTDTCCPTCLVSPSLLRTTLSEKFSYYIPPMASCNSCCYPSRPDHSLAFAQQANLPGHAGWLLRAGGCSVGTHSCHCLVMPNPTPSLCHRHLPHLQTMSQGLPLLLRQFLLMSTPHLPEAPTLPQPTFHRFIQTCCSHIST